MRGTYGLLVLLAFAVGSIGAFLLFDWPPLLKQIVLGYLLVFLIVRLVLVLGRFLLAPGAERFRLVPMATATARFWFVWSAILVGWFFFVKFTLSGLAVLGISRPAGYLVGLACGVLLVGLALYVVWRHPARETGGSRQPAASARRLAALALSGGRLAAAVHRLADAILRGRGPPAAADRDPRRQSRGQPRAAPGGQSCRRRLRSIADRRHDRARAAARCC